jgi:flagellar motor switch protein FliN
MTDEAEAKEGSPVAETMDEGVLKDLGLKAVYDIPVNITVVLGRTSMTVNQLLKLSKGSVIELDKSVGEPIEMHVNNRLVAKGEVVIVEERIGITLTEIVKEGN